MHDFILYQSAVPYYRFSMSEGRLLCSARDVHTGAWSAAQPLGGALEAQICERYAFPVFEMLALEKGLADSIRTGAEEFRVGSHRYQRVGAHRCVERDRKPPVDLLFDAEGIYAYVVPTRDRITICVRSGMEDRTVLADWAQSGVSEPCRSVRPRAEALVTMRDGVKLATDIYLPAGDDAERFPTVLVRTPYGKRSNPYAYYSYVMRGFAVVVQDVRGREASEGEWYPFLYEKEDGSDTLDWIAAQPWSNGDVGMFGASYLGSVQWSAAATGNPHLKAIVSLVTAGGPFTDMPRRGGTVSAGVVPWMSMLLERDTQSGRLVREDWDTVLRHRPLNEIFPKFFGVESPYWLALLEHENYDDFWRRADWAADAARIDVPALILSGWFDDDGTGSSEAAEIVQRYPAGRKKILFGAWMHSANSKRDIHGFDVGADALRYDLDLEYTKWFERFLRGAGIPQTADVEYYTLGDMRWRTAQSWPPANVAPVRLLLSSTRGANSSDGDGRLEPDAHSAAACRADGGTHDTPGADALKPGAPEGAQAEPEAGRKESDTYRYDPLEPIEHLLDPSENEGAVPGNYREVEKNPGVLVYTSRPLAHDLTVAGDPFAELYISADAPDTDLIVKITDVDPAGNSIKISDGLLRVKLREGFDRPKFLKPGETALCRIPCFRMGYVFKRGHRIRLTVTSSAYRLVMPSYNSVEPQGTAVVPRIANVTVHHSDICPSSLTLPALRETTDPSDCPSP